MIGAILQPPLCSVFSGWYRVEDSRPEDPGVQQAVDDQNPIALAIGTVGCGLGAIIGPWGVNGMLDFYEGIVGLPIIERESRFHIARILFQP